ncbi:UDP-glycosyltransferase UGT5-like [Zophobas morio]|uniref:UDP-glycosyltransferase UGT5-like n=1 Tax=Zophobas morio TaxID=2755281 RepID=UPI0030834617
MKSLVPVILILLATTQCGSCAKILGVFSIPGRSHYLLGATLMKALAEKGHDVTMISSFGEKEPPKTKGTYRDIVVTEVIENMNEMIKEQKMNMFDREKGNPFLETIIIGYMMPKMMEPVLGNKEVQKLIHSDEKFDVVIIEQFVNDAEKALATHFGAPLIVVSPVGANSWVNTIVGNPGPTSYIPTVLTDYLVPMTFCERLMNSVLHVIGQIIYHLYVYPTENAKIKKYIPNGPDISDVLYNASIVLMNSHPSLNQPVPYVPNMIDVGGFHVKPPKKLPQDLQEFLDNAKDGVIYFSMGSNLKSAEFPPEKRDAILRTFAKLKEQVLWKWEEDVLPGQPKNVKLSKWFPQQDILAHPNVKLFITHGGFLSTTETVYHGVPILAIPILGDQKLNAKSAMSKGFGLVLPYSELTEDKLTQSIQEILNNPKYKDNAKQISENFHERQVSPMETAIYWIEYVIRHKGAPHLRVAALDLPWYQYYLLDVIGFLVLVSSVIACISYYSIRAVCKKLCKKGKSKKLKQK